MLWYIAGDQERCLEHGTRSAAKVTLWRVAAANIERNIDYSINKRKVS